MSLAAQLGLNLDDPDVVDVGQEHFIRIMYEDDTEQVISGLVLVHPHKKDPDQVCQGFADVGPGEWEIVVRDPLTIWPSFVCNDCKDHGIVKQGKWQEAIFLDPRRQRQMPVWLRYAMKSFCSSDQEIDHYYRRPDPDLNFYSISYFVERHAWNAVAKWLNKQYNAYITEQNQEELTDEGS